MFASVIIEYSVKSLNKVFDYIVPDNLKDIIKVGHKVVVPFAHKEVEGFVLKLHNNRNDDTTYKSIIEIEDTSFYLNEELIALGKEMSNSLMCNLISCYQVMLPKALKASIKTNINKKYITYVSLNENEDIDSYIQNHKRAYREIEVINILKNGEKLKSEINASCLKKLIDNKIVLQREEIVNRDVSYIKDEDKDIILNENQVSCVNEILNSNDKTFLLYGVTGSGKTEVYIRLIKEALKNNKTSILLLPEISLTPQIVSRFKSVFGSSVAVFHSSLSQGEKYDEYRRIMNGEVSIVVGARSAVFAPLKNLGLIIVDECQSSSYKQDNNPKYDAIWVAGKRSAYNNSKVILGSATPSLEQYSRAKNGMYHLVNLGKRISGRFPNIKLVDMEVEAKKHNYIISDELDSEIKSTLSRGEQVILLLNRRGYSTFSSCTACGYVYTCPNCDISLIYHKSSNSYSCHYCGYRCGKSNICPKCKQDGIKDLGLGTEKLQSILEEKYKVNVLRMDADTTRAKNSHQKLINEFSNGSYSILVGTQMVSKGLNFKNVSLVGIINADASLSIPDFRSGEKTYELLSQTSGRVGRFELPGKVIIQTYNPGNYVYQNILKNDYDAYFNDEMKIRNKLKYPPFYYICNITIISSMFDRCKVEANKIKDYLDKSLNNDYLILGPSVAGIVKLKNKYRFNIMIKYKDSSLLYSALNSLNKVTIKDVDIDINMNI